MLCGGRKIGLGGDIVRKEGGRDSKKEKEHETYHHLEMGKSLSQSILSVCHDWYSDKIFMNLDKHENTTTVTLMNSKGTRACCEDSILMTQVHKLDQQLESGDR